MLLFDLFKIDEFKIKLWLWFSIKSSELKDHMIFEVDSNGFTGSNDISNSQFFINHFIFFIQHN